MKYPILLMGFAAAAAGLAGQAAELPKAETLLDAYVQATGGRQSYEKRTSEFISGVVEIPAQGIKGKIEMWAEAPNRRVEIVDIDGVGRIENGTDGTIAWENSAIMGPRLRSGAELRFYLHEAVFNGPIHWRELYKSAETTGVEQVDGAECYKLTMVPTEGKPETWYIDQKTNYVVKMLRTEITTMGEVAGELMMKDYKDLSGVITPTVLIQKAAGQEIRVTFDKVVPNAPIPKDRFSPPAEVKPLLAPPAPAPAPAPTKKAA